MIRVLSVLLSPFARGVSVFTSRNTAPFYSRYTLRFHLPAELLLGAVGGITQLGDLVARKTLGAPDWMIALQSSIPTVALLFAMVWRDLLEGASRRKVLLATGLFGKGLLLFMAAAASPGLFLLVFIAFSFADSAFIPVRNSIFRANYPDALRGRYFGLVVSLTSLAVIGANLVAAWLLDRWEGSYRLLFPAAGVLGLIAHATYARLRVRGDGQIEHRAPTDPLLRRAAGSIRRAFRSTVRILKADRAFFAYESAFFLYGLAFLMNLPLVVLLITDRLHLSYGQASWARFVVPPVMMVLFSPIAGRLLDRSHSSVMMGVACFLLAAHSVLLAAANGIGLLMLSYFIFGVAMTGVNLAWNLGPVQFARTEHESLDYMGVHVTLTGLRGAIAPFLALGAKRFLGLTAGFVVSTALFLTAALLMARLSRRISSAAPPPATIGRPDPRAEERRS
ncbi:MAG: MFS transporter [Planctomycetes bacterium]|nr:MFS transporter [Planctomycetota bacterium]